MSNPKLVRVASESTKIMRTEDLRNAGEQLKYTCPEEIAKIAKETTNASLDAQVNWELNAAEMLKKQVPLPYN